MKSKKLTLKKETLRQLNETELKYIVNGGITDLPDENSLQPGCKLTENWCPDHLNTVPIQCDPPMTGD